MPKKVSKKKLKKRGGFRKGGTQLLIIEDYSKNLKLYPSANDPTHPKKGS